MIKLIIFTLILKTVLVAKVVSQSDQNSIMIEALLFVVVFGTMGIISYIYSSKHAKAYKKEELLQGVVEERVEKDRISELSEMLENGTLTKEEFELLNNYYLQS